jgi:polyribonucleotide nucleotidyltransferase
MLKTIRDLTVGNNKNQIEALKTQLELQKRTLQNLEAEKNAAIDAVRETGKLEGWTEEQITTEVNRLKTTWDEIISNQEEAIRDTEETLLDSWMTLFDTIKTNYEDLLEELVAKYEKTMSAGFGDYGVFEEAYERKKELDEEYLEDYEKLYELSKLTRSISTSMDETDNIKGKERLKTL